MLTSSSLLRLFLLITTSVLLFVNGVRGDAEDKGEIVELTNDNFEKFADGKNHLFVKFFAPWCGHCKSMAPAWAELSKLAKSESDVIIADVDATQQGDLASKYGVTGYPTLKYFGKTSLLAPDAEDYKGGRTLSAMIDWVNDKAGTTLSEGGEEDPLKTGKLIQLTEALTAYFASTTADDKTATRKAFEDAVDGLDDKFKQMKDYYKKKVLGKSTTDIMIDDLKTSWNTEMTRLKKMKDEGASSIAESSKQWLNQRMNILKHLTEITKSKDKKEEL